MKKSKTRIIQIAGLRGLFMTAFIIVCLGAGFIVFPAKVAVYFWNYAVVNHFALPSINLFQGMLLWAITVLVCYIANNNKMVISFAQPAQLSEDEMQTLMEKIKVQAQAKQLNTMILKSEDVNPAVKSQEIEQTEEVNTSEHIENKN